ncbi:MAG: transcriptional repressor [Actinomycetes bacterium]|jgi:Fur family ferric uptake transcriptional regulator
MTVPTKRNTRQRTAILDFLKTRKEFISAKDLYAEMGTSNIGLSTIYRALSDLVNDGDLDVFIDNDGESRFRLCGSHHHHHLLCRKCGKSVEFQAPEAEELAERLGASEGFTNMEHRLEIVGTCSTCA